MPVAGNESDGGAVGTRKRQPMNKANSFGAASGYSTDESSVSHHDVVSRKDRKQQQQQRRGGKRPEQQDSKASVIWMVFVVGLLFCMLDAMYISRVLDRGGGDEPEKESQSEATMRILGQLKEERIKHHAISDSLNQNQHERQQQSSTAFKASSHDHQPLAKSSNSNINIPQTKSELAEARKQKRLAEKKEAEVSRMKIIKAAALDALKAQNGGKIPADMLEKALAEDDEGFKPRPMEEYREKAIADDKTRILELFIDAGLKEMDDSTYAVLPSWTDVSSLYGEEPHILGLEQCEAFKAKGNPWDHFVSTAGTFNSGTNLMAEMLIHNCHMQSRMDKLGNKNRGIRWQVPWGKHTPPGNEEYRLAHKSTKDAGVDANMILPAVTVRDPYYWMQSMCKHHYTASWRASSERCPNLTPSEMDIANFPMLANKNYFPVSVRYADFNKHHESLTGLWNDWYSEYRGAEFQRLFVRYEDLLFHPRHVAESVCHCAGGTMNQGKFQYVVDSAKKGTGAHGKVRTGYIDAIIKYGSERNRYNGFHTADLKYTREHLDEGFMKELGYKFHPMSLETQNENKDDGEKDAGNEHEDEPEEHKEDHVQPDVPDEEAESNKVDPEESADLGDKEIDEGKTDGNER